MPLCWWLAGMNVDNVIVMQPDMVCSFGRHDYIELDETAQIRLFGNLIFSCEGIGEVQRPSMLRMGKQSVINVGGDFRFYYGADILVGENAKLLLGSNSFINSNCKIRCKNEIIIGNDCSISYDFICMDSDWHEIDHSLKSLPVNIGNHVLIGARVTILKGVNIGDGCVIGAGAVVTRDIFPHCLAVGVPAHVIKENIEWH